MEALGILLLLIGLFLMTKRRFWAFAFWLAALASFFSMVASVIHFQILGAIGFFVLMSICEVIAETFTE